MTREHKLALIVGFSLILLVGVLISDHLSRAREERVAAVDSPPPPAHVVEPLLGSPPEPMVVSFQSDVVAEAPGVGGDEQANLAPRPEPSEPAWPREPIVEIAQSPGDGWLGVETRQSWDDALERQVVDAGGRIDSGMILLPQGGPRTEPLVSRTATPATSPGVPRAPAVTQAEAWHAVSKGETLFQIAARYYGTGHAWRRLAEHNKGRVGADGAVREGARLRIPAREVILGTPHEAPGATPAPKPPPTPTPAPAPKPGASGYATYTVRGGDTLGVIAQKQLGSVRRIRELVELNNLDDEDTIRAGMVLKIPAG